MGFWKSNPIDSEEGKAGQTNWRAAALHFTFFVRLYRFPELINRPFKLAKEGFTSQISHGCCAFELSELKRKWIMKFFAAQSSRIQNPVILGANYLGKIFRSWWRPQVRIHPPLPNVLKFFWSPGWPPPKKRIAKRHSLLPSAFGGNCRS